MLFLTIRGMDNRLNLKSIVPAAAASGIPYGAFRVSLLSYKTSQSVAKENELGFAAETV
jgi:hypothetical protein